MKPLSEMAYDSVRAGAPGLSDATCKVIAASIARKARPVPAPSAAPPAPTVEEVALMIRECVDVDDYGCLEGFGIAAARIIELFKGRGA